MLLLILVSVDLSIGLFWGFGYLESVSYICNTKANQIENG
jgi:hypothetical protein